MLQFAMSRGVAHSGEPHHSNRKAALRNVRRAKRERRELPRTSAFLAQATGCHTWLRTSNA
jgi:hypothetical protein